MKWRSSYAISKNLIPLFILVCTLSQMTFQIHSNAVVHLMTSFPSYYYTHGMIYKEQVISGAHSFWYLSAGLSNLISLNLKRVLHSGIHITMNHLVHYLRQKHQ